AAADVAAERDALASFKECAGLQERMANADHVTSRWRGTRVEVVISRGECMGSDTYLLLRPGHCDANGFTLKGPRIADERLVFLAGAGELADVSRRLDAVVVDNTNTVELAVARAAIALSPLTGGRAIPRQPDHPGRPVASPTAIWPAAVLRDLAADEAT